MGQQTKEILPTADYTVAVVGPSKGWGFDGDKGRVEMATDSIQFEGHEQYWIDVNRQASAEAPKKGAVLNGRIEQDEAGKYPPKFIKSKSGGGGWGGGGGKSSPGAIWSSAVETATHVLAGYYAATGTKPKSIAEYLGKIEVLAPKINTLVDKLAGANKPAATEDKSEKETGETPGAAPAAPAAAATAPAAKAEVVIEDISDEDLGDW